MGTLCLSHPSPNNKRSSSNATAAAGCSTQTALFYICRYKIEDGFVVRRGRPFELIITLDESLEHDDQAIIMQNDDKVCSGSDNGAAFTYP
jgi:hypothetical protein